MRNYEIFKSEYDFRFIVFVYNKGDMQSVQKQFIEWGYIITEDINENYFKAYKFKEAQK